MEPKLGTYLSATLRNIDSNLDVIAMTDHDEMDADELSQEIAERRGDAAGTSDFRSPPPSAEKLWACASLLEELDEATHGVGLSALSEPLGGHEAGAANDTKEVRALGATRPEAIARLWLKADDEGLFDPDEAEPEDDSPEYTDEELASALEKKANHPHDLNDSKRLNAAADRLRAFSSLVDEANDVIDKIHSLTGDDE